jgi:peptidylprolyl isomerase
MNPDLKFRGQALLGTVLISIVVLAIEPSRAFAQSNEVIAKVGKTEVTSAEVQSYLNGLDAATKKRASTNHDFLVQIVRNHLGDVALYNEAHAKGWDKRPDVQLRIEQATRQVVEQSYLDSVSSAPADFPSEKEVQSVYDQHKDSFMSPRAYRVSQIFVRTGENADKATIEQAQKKIAEIAKQAHAKGADFASLAKSNTPDDAKLAAAGGDLGFIPESQLLPEVRFAVSGMAKGDTSDPIRLPDGYVIVHLTDTRAAAVRPLSEVADHIRARMRQVREQETARTYVDNLVKANPITINEIELSKLGESLK